MGLFYRLKPWLRRDERTRRRHADWRRAVERAKDWA
jgi:hypothetical protein